MQPHEIILVIASTLTAVGTILGIARFWLKRAYKTFLIDTIKDIREEEIPRESILYKRQKDQDAVVIEIKNHLESISQKISAVSAMADKNFMMIRRNEILMLVNTQPQKVDTIEALYDEYKKRGGNSYIAELIDVWRDEYARDVLAKRIKKGGK